MSPGENLAVTITQNDLDTILENISTNCAFYTDQVDFGVRMTLDAVLKLIEEKNFL